MAWRLTGSRIESEIVEMNVVDHCNMACRSCSHLSPIASKRLASIDEVVRDLSLLAPHYHAGVLRLLGGEPLLHAALPELIEAVRETGIADAVSVVTNGTLLHRVPTSFWQAVDIVDVSLYPGREPDPQIWASVRAQAEAHGTRIRIKRFTHFRESYSEMRNDDEQLVRRIYRTCQIAHIWGCHNVHKQMFYRCPQAHVLFERLNGDGAAGSRDGVPLTPSPDLLHQLIHYLGDATPLAACRHCLGSVGVRFSHAEIKPGPAWRKPQTVPAPSLVDWVYLAHLETVDPEADNGCVE